MVKIAGKYLYTSGENFDEFLKEIGKFEIFCFEWFFKFTFLFLGISHVLRNLAKINTPTVIVEVAEDGVYTITTETTFKTTCIKFRLGQEFNEERLDGGIAKASVLESVLNEERLW